jgi:competence protein ComEC
VVPELGRPCPQGGFDVVKIPHHGSPHQHPRFASWADAEVAIVSVGAHNSFGHPADSTIAQWQESGATVVRTDLHGDVAIVIDHQQQVGWVPRRGP